MLKKWHAPLATSLWAEEVPDEGAEIPIWPMVTEKFVVGGQLSMSRRKELMDKLKSYADVLRARPGLTNITEHRIPLASRQPIRLPPYRLPHSYRAVVRDEISKMLEEGIIEPSKSAWAAPIVLVPKKDGTLRFCVDYRRLNAETCVDAYPMPRIDDLIDQLGQSKYITTQDLSRGYWQVPVTEKDQHKTAFTTPFGLYQFKVMPFGLCGAPATFQRMMDQILRGLETFAAAYLDDLVIFSSTWEEHLEQLDVILTRLRNAGLTAKPSKCQFVMTQCVYLGHVVGDGVVKPEETKVKAVQDFPVPQTKRQVRAFLGLTGYYRRFIPNYSCIASPLTDLTKKSSGKLSWDNNCQKAFETLKDLLCSHPMLQSPDFQKEYKQMLRIEGLGQC